MNESEIGFGFFSTRRTNDQNDRATEKITKNFSIDFNVTHNHLNHDRRASGADSGRERRHEGVGLDVWEEGQGQPQVS